MEKLDLDQSTVVPSESMSTIPIKDSLRTGSMAVSSVKPCRIWARTLESLPRKSFCKSWTFWKVVPHSSPKYCTTKPCMSGLFMSGVTLTVNPPSVAL